MVVLSSATSSFNAIMSGSGVRLATTEATG
jgi:hypothetical protein